MKYVENKVKSVETYVDNLETERVSTDIMTVEHRSNNTKRDFLFVNKIQGKHIPCSPKDTIKLVDSLLCKVDRQLNEKYDEFDFYYLTVIGFSETATALGTLLGKRYARVTTITNTTREDMSKFDSVEKLLNFEEEHSHATTQQLYTLKESSETSGGNTLEEVIRNNGYILFVEDEISTGNTIINFVDALSKRFGKDIMYTRFGVASICNWQSEEDIKKFEEMGIDRFYLISGNLKSTNIKMDVTPDMILDGRDAKDAECKETISLMNGHKSHSETYDDNTDSEFLENRVGYYPYDNHRVYETLGLREVLEPGSSVRIIGSEEFMYKTIELGRSLELNDYKVKVQSTTRSKIDVLNSLFDDSSSGIKCRTRVNSAYEYERDTYIYNTDDDTDYVIIMTDSLDEEQTKKYMNSIGSLFEGRCKKIIGITY